MLYKVTFNFQVWAHEYPDLHPDTTLRESFHVNADTNIEAFVRARYQAESYARLLGYHGTCCLASTDKEADIIVRESSQQELDAELEEIMSDPLLAIP